MSRPVVAILSLGGTIASVPPAPGRAASMDLDAGDLLRGIPELGEVAELRPEAFRRLGSADLAFTDLAELAARIRVLEAEGVSGVVVTQGTDTLEETAFVLDRLLGGDVPVVVTGAMRHAGRPGADGPANLLGAARLAASPLARDLGVLVLMNDEIHLARFVRKGHATSVATFQSPPLGPVGWIAEGRVRIPLLPRRRAPSLVVAPGAAFPAVALIKFSLDDHPHAIESAAAGPYSGAVVETFGAGHTGRRALDALATLAAAMPTVYASRTGAGEVHIRSCDFPGSELRLLERGLIPSGGLDGLKARLLLTLLLAAGSGRELIRAAFAGAMD